MPKTKKIQIIPSKAPTQSAKKSKAKTSVKPVAKPVVKPVVKPVAKPGVKPVMKSSVKPECMMVVSSQPTYLYSQITYSTSVVSSDGKVYAKTLKLVNDNGKITHQKKESRSTL
jgi:hypothetical protein